MVSKMSFIYSICAVMCLISTIQSVSPPTNYTWPRNTQNLCFAGRFDLSLNVQYLQANGTNNTVNIPLNNNTYETYSVSCDQAAIRQLTITMLGGFSAIIFEFSVDAKNQTSLYRVHGYITINDKQDVFPNYAPTINGTHEFSSNESLFSTDRGNSYRCNTKTKIEGFHSESDLTVMSIEVENLRIQPFVDRTQAFSDYGVEKVCEADDEKTSNLVPIIVGACLAVLVVIVLVAYLIGRRRSRNGYQSV